MTPSDVSLWERAQVGDADAFGLLFERHAKQIYNYCFRASGNWSAAEDMLSQTFLEAWRRRDKELPEDKVLPWLFGIAINVTRNGLRSEKRLSAALRRAKQQAVSLAVPDFAESSDIRIDDERRMGQAMILLSRLARHEREVFLLCASMDLSYEDAALALAVPVGTVRSRLSRARTHLRELESASGHKEDRTAMIEEALQE